MEGGLLLDLTQAADSISLDCSISPRQPSKQGRWGVPGWVRGPHTESRFHRCGGGGALGSGFSDSTEATR